MVSHKSFALVTQPSALLLILLEFCGSGRLSSACIEPERIGLIKLKAAFNLPNGSTFPWWRDDQGDCCRWEGVWCNNISMRVTMLLLNDTRDSRLGPWSLNASLFLPFEELEALDLGFNQLTAFTETLRLKRLQVLDLRTNELTEVPSLHELPSLNALYLQFNYRLKNLSRLEGLKLEAVDVSFNHLAGDSLSAIWSMTSLKALSIAGNQLGDSIFQGLCQLKGLEELDASYNEFVSSIPPCIQNMTSLYALDLHRNHFGGNIPSSLFTNLKSLQYLSLSGNAFEGSFSLAALTNNSRLEVFDLANNYHRLNITTEDPLYAPSAQLKILRLSDCALNEPRGVFPTFLRDQHELRLLDLSHNNMSGAFPSWLLENNTKLEALKLSNNAFSGSFSFNSSTTSNVDIQLIDVSSNFIDGELPVSIGSSFPNSAFINMSRNLIHGGIPSSLGDMRLLSLLDLSNNDFIGELPESLLCKCQRLEVLKLSKNNLRGEVLPRMANLTKLRTLSLENNQFSGVISPGLLNSPGLHILDVSSNFLSGTVPSWIGDFESLENLMLTDNSLEGPLPLSFCKLNLKLFCIAANGFGPTIPTCANVSRLLHLSLGSNHLTGPFPQFLSDASSIVTLDLRNNGYSGKIPTWIGSFPNLQALLLKGNNFEGLIPRELCQLKNMSIMDLSNNSLSGPIPSCLNNMDFGNLRVLGAFRTLSISTASAYMIYKFNSKVSFFVENAVETAYTDDQLVEVKFISKSRLESYRGNILEYMSGLDLSCNNLTGSIPQEIGYMINLLILNLSNNHLMGPIPSTFSGLKQIESLDLSYNRLTGKIPPQLTELSFLSIFTVAHNNLSGQTPERKNQFATFDERSYEGNIFLCGPPLESCNTSGQSPLTPPIPDQKEDYAFRDAFTWSFAGSYVIAFLGTVAFLFMLNFFR
ncbi:receptor-like protein 15 isoform X3 [Punica granatum]|uniref:Receptor-like protein 15 isoform X3 n=1 Tax=Punica granatum TaxID=22663 RepID=A0A6P8BYH2_PUNGR|nr:receptor-like protein 15 isoform X3 [Punica granatum]